MPTAIVSNSFAFAVIQPWFYISPFSKTICQAASKLLIPFHTQFSALIIRNDRYYQSPYANHLSLWHCQRIFTGQPLAKRSVSVTVFFYHWAISRDIAKGLVLGIYTCSLMVSSYSQTVSQLCMCSHLLVYMCRLELASITFAGTWHFIGGI